LRGLCSCLGTTAIYQQLNDATAEHTLLESPFLASITIHCKDTIPKI
jgi:hypothetical protein